MVALILLTLIGIFWLVSSRRWRRQFVRPLAVLVVSYIVFTSPLTVKLANWGLTAHLPTDNGESADVIVVLGRGEALRELRTDLAYQLWRAKRAPRVFISGMMDAQPIAEQLQRIGIPGSQLDGESCSQSTEENSLYTSALLYPGGTRKVILVTDPPHLWRSLLLFRSVGFTVIPHASPLPILGDTTQQLPLILREYIGLAHNAVMGRFNLKPTPELQQPSPAILKKFDDWNCRVRLS